MKTIFIIISRGFIVRNILRSGVLDYLKKDNVRIVIFMVIKKGREAPEHLKKEFADKNVSIEWIFPFWEEGLLMRAYSFFARKVALLVYTRSTWKYSRIGSRKNIGRSNFSVYIERYIYSVLSRIHFFKTIARLINQKVFGHKYCVAYFEQCKPDIVFTTSILATPDMFFMIEARKRHIQTISMPKGWDNITKKLYKFIPDKLIVQNQIMKEGAVKVQRVAPNKIVICGFPRFDWYCRKDILISREEYFALIGLEPDRRLIFFGSEGAWAPEDDKIVKYLIELVNADNRLVKPACLLARPHFSNVKQGRFNRFVGQKNVKVDDNITISDYFHDNWDPTNKETIQFVNSIYHCDMMITVASTLALDACCLDKPVIGVAYGVLHDPRSGEDISPILYESDHYQAVMDTGAVDLVKSDKELLNSINKYLTNPEHKSAERQRLRDELCYKVDGQSAKRMADAILRL